MRRSTLNYRPGLMGLDEPSELEALELDDADLRLMALERRERAVARREERLRWDVGKWRVSVAVIALALSVGFVVVAHVGNSYVERVPLAYDTMMSLLFAFALAGWVCCFCGLFASPGDRR